MPKAKRKPEYALFPVKLYTDDEQMVECLQYCRIGERPLSGKRRAQEQFDSIEDALKHYARACRPPVPLLILSAPVA